MVIFAVDCRLTVFDDWYTVGTVLVDMWRLANGDFCCFDCLLTVFDKWYTVPIVKNTQNHWCTNRHSSTKTVPTVYQRCTNRQKNQKQRQSKGSQNSKMTIGVPIVAGLPRLYQQCTNSVPIVKNSQNTVKTAQKWPSVYQSSHVYQDCTNRVPTVYQNSQKTVKTAKMTIGVRIVTGLPRLYQQCNNSLPIANKNLPIANRSRVSCAHNTSRAFIGRNITPWPWNLD